MLAIGGTVRTFGLNTLSGSSKNPPEKRISANADPEGSRDEFRIKGAFLFKFIKYTRWPTEHLPEGAPIQVVLAGPQPHLAEIESLLEGRKIRGHTIYVKRVKKAKDVRAPTVLFCAGLKPEEEAQLLESFGRKPILFVGNEEGSAVRGATMGFYSSDGKVRFAVNKQSAKKSKLKISSELLKLAKIVGMPQ